MPEAESEKPMCDDMDTSVDTSDSGMDTTDTSMDTDTGTDTTESIDDSGTDCDDSTSDGLTDDTNDSDTSEETTDSSFADSADADESDSAEGTPDESDSEASDDAAVNESDSPDEQAEDGESDSATDDDTYDSDAEGLPENDEFKDNNENFGEPIDDNSIEHPLSEPDANSFDDNGYKTFRTTEPMTVYRYFGSDKTPTEVAQSNSNGWGSDAGGRFATLNGDMTPEQAKQDLALSPDWGNSAVYRSKMEIPAGTEISVGKAKPQIAADGTICDGGGDQIVLNQPWTDDMDSWIKECKPIGDIPDSTGTEYIIEDNDDTPVDEAYDSDAEHLPEDKTEGNSEKTSDTEETLDTGSEESDSNPTEDTPDGKHNEASDGDSYYKPLDRDTVPEPNTRYRDAGGNTYKTDDMGRTTLAEGYIKNQPIDERNNAAQKNVLDKQPDDHGGHFLAHGTGGADSRVNMAAQNGNLNQGEYKAMELNAKKAFDDGNSVYRTVQTEYPDSSMRPSKYYVTDTVMDSSEKPIQTHNYTFRNENKATREAIYENATKQNMAETAKQDAIDYQRRDDSAVAFGGKVKQVKK